MHLYICIKTCNNQLMRVQKTMRCQEFLCCKLLLIVGCVGCGYQLREEALLEGVFIGNFVRRGIRDIAACTCFYGYAAVQSTSQLTPQLQFMAVDSHLLNILQFFNGAILSSRCPKMKINEEKMSQFQFHFPGLLVPYEWYQPGSVHIWNC